MSNNIFVGKNPFSTESPTLETTGTSSLFEAKPEPEQIIEQKSPVAFEQNPLISQSSISIFIEKKN